MPGPEVSECPLGNDPYFALYINPSLTIVVCSQIDNVDSACTLHGLVTDRVEDAEGNDMMRQEAQRPSELALPAAARGAERWAGPPSRCRATWRAAGCRGTFCRGRARSPRERRGGRRSPPWQCGSLGSWRIGDQAKLVSVGDGEGQDAGAAHLLAGTAEPLRCVPANRAFFIHDPDNIFLLRDGGSSSHVDLPRQPLLRRYWLHR